MRTINKLLFIGLFTTILAVRCKTKTASDKTNTDTTAMQISKNFPATKFDTVSEQLSSKSELMTEDLIALRIIDTSLLTQLSETCYCDTTVQLNDSVYYSIISVGDQAGICSYVFVTSMNGKIKKVIGSKYLYPDCDVDYSWDTYELNEHKVISEYKIQLTKTKVFQKKNRTSPNEEDNIDHKQEEKQFITVSKSGQINDSK